MSQTVSQVTFFRVKPSVRPEDPDSEEGEALLGIFRTTQHQSGHEYSAWGRTAEDKDTIVWVVGEFSNPAGQLSNYNIPTIYPTHTPTNLLPAAYGSNQTNRLD